MAAVPYIALKVVWLSGGTVGLAAPAQFDNLLYVVANGVTLAMDGLAIVLFLAMVQPWGQRLPAWLLLPPVWAASGLLIPVAFTFLLAGGGMGGGGAVTGDGLQPWVYSMVYSGFSIQAIAMASLSVVYMRRRWPGLVDGARGSALLAVAGTAVAVVLVAAAAVLVARAVGWAVPGDSAATTSLATRVGYIVHAAAAATAAAGGAGLLWSGARRAAVGDRGGRQSALWWLLFTAWFGTAACAMWATYELLTGVAFEDSPGRFWTMVAVARLAGAVLMCLLILDEWRRRSPSSSS